MGRTDAEVEMPIPWTSDVKNWLTGKDPDAGKDWRQEEKGMTVDEMVGWHHRLNGPESEQVSGVGDIHGSLAWGCKDVYMTEWLNWTELKIMDLWMKKKHVYVLSSLSCLQLYVTLWTGVLQ